MPKILISRFCCNKYGSENILWKQWVSREPKQTERYDKSSPTYSARGVGNNLGSVDDCILVASHRLVLHSAHTHTHTRLTAFFSGTTRVSRYQKGKTNLDFKNSQNKDHKFSRFDVCTSYSPLLRNLLRIRRLRVPKIIILLSHSLHAKITFVKFSRYSGYTLQVWWTKSQPLMSDFSAILYTQHY